MTEWYPNYQRMSIRLKFAVRHGGYYLSNPSRSQSSPWATPDWARKWHPLNALLAERRAIIAGERAALDAAEKRDAAWWREVGRG